MSTFKISSYAFYSAVLMLCGSAAQATTLYVHCGAVEGLNSIGAAINALKHSESTGPATINVSGACDEDVVIQSMSRITLNAVNGASITDPSHGANVTVVIDDSQEIALNNFVINGDPTSNSQNEVVDCQNGSLCHFSGNTVQNGPNGAGLGIWAGSYGTVDGGFLQNNTGSAGLIVGNGGRARAVGVMMQGNFNGVIVFNGGLAQLVTSTMRNNYAEGISVNQGTLLCVPCTVTGNGLGNGADGVHLESSSSVVFRNGTYSVTGNAGAGVSLSNLSSAQFGATTDGSNLSGNHGAYDIVCNPSFTTATGRANVAGARVTGCP
jgi:hypothetical protein